MSAHWLGIDIGGTKILAVRMAADGSIVDERRVATESADGPQAILGRVVELAHDLGDSIQFAAVGVGFAGLVDHRTQVVDSSVILPGWDGFRLGAELGAALGRPTVVDNDATVAGLGEYEAVGAPPGMHMLLLTVGTGIGGAIVIDGELYRGASNTSAEFGNTTIDWNGRECVSGNRGSLNTLASGTALLRHAAERGLEVDSGAELGELAAGGDQRAREAIDLAARALGAGLANFVNVFNPHRVVLTGGVCNLGPSYLETVRAELHARAFPINARHADVVFSKHGDRTTAHGAACFARRAYR